jgi:hypothetical protein
MPGGGEGEGKHWLSVRVRYCASRRAELCSEGAISLVQQTQASQSCALVGASETAAAASRTPRRRVSALAAGAPFSTLLVLGCLTVGELPPAHGGWEAGSSKSLTSYTPGKAEFVHGWGVAGENVKFCPWKCVGNSDFGTQKTAPPQYEAHWDREGWKEPAYGFMSQEEKKAGAPPPDLGYVQAGEATYCKKPYPVCEYPNGDVFVRHALQEISVLNTNPQCLSSMKHFLCALYRRRCETNQDSDPTSPTFQHQGILPVCFPQCMNAYKDCSYSHRHATLMCGEYIKAGWVEWDLSEVNSDQCDAPAASLRPRPWAAWAAALCSLLYLRRRT